MSKQGRNKRDYSSPIFASEHIDFIVIIFRWKWHDEEMNEMNEWIIRSMDDEMNKKQELVERRPRF